MQKKWNIVYQLVPPDLHRRNAAERAIRTFKAKFLAIVAGVATDFPHYLWDLLLPQTEITLNLLRQSTEDPTISAWDFFSGPFNYDVTPLGPLGIRVISHEQTIKAKFVGLSMERMAGALVSPLNTTGSNSTYLRICAHCQYPTPSNFATSISHIPQLQPKTEYYMEYNN